MGGADNVGEVTLYPPPKDDEVEDEEGVTAVEDVGLLGFAFAIKPASPMMANSALYQIPFEIEEDRAKAKSLDFTLNLRISYPSSRSFITFCHRVLKHH